MGANRLFSRIEQPWSNGEYLITTPLLYSLHHDERRKPERGWEEGRR